MVPAAVLPPWLCTMALSVKDAPAAGLLSLTDGVPTTRSGAASRFP